jgi:hypothetical protein
VRVVRGDDIDGASNIAVGLPALGDCCAAELRWRKKDRLERPVHARGWLASYFNLPAAGDIDFATAAGERSPGADATEAAPTMRCCRGWK